MLLEKRRLMTWLESCQRCSSYLTWKCLMKTCLPFSSRALSQIKLCKTCLKSRLDCHKFPPNPSRVVNRKSHYLAATLLSQVVLHSKEQGHSRATSKLSRKLAETRWIIRGWLHRALQVDNLKCQTPITPITTTSHLWQYHLWEAGRITKWRVPTVACLCRIAKLTSLWLTCLIRT